MERMQFEDKSTAHAVMGSGDDEKLRFRGRYAIECLDADGNVKWTDVIENVVVDVGVRLALDTILGNSAAGAVNMMLKGTGTAVVGDTMASHASWLEVGGANAPAYSGNRPTPTFSAASGTGAGARTKATSAAVSFTFTSGGTVAGCAIGLGIGTTKDATTGTLLSAGDFTGGSRTVVATDVLNVTFQLSA